MTDREIFKTNLAALMKKAKAKQIDVAKYAEVSYQTVSAWVCGRGYPRADAMEKLCSFFGVKQSALTEKQSEKTPEDDLVAMFRALPVEAKEKLLERADELTRRYVKKKVIRRGKVEAKI